MAWPQRAGGVVAGDVSVQVPSLTVCAAPRPSRAATGSRAATSPSAIPTATARSPRLQPASR